MDKPLLNDTELEKSEVVANAIMNRQRGLAGGNSYQKELGFNPLEFLQQHLVAQQKVAWADICCGTGKALIQAAQACMEKGLQEKVTLVGVDLVPMFDPIPLNLDFLILQESSLSCWRPSHRFDLITCVHGLHYLGDKLGIIQEVSTRLSKGGLFAGHLDYANLHLTNANSARISIGREFAKAGFRYDTRRHLLSCRGPILHGLPYRYIGADAHAGPNYTGQPAVNSYYLKLSR